MASIFVSFTVLIEILCVYTAFSFFLNYTHKLDLYST